MEGSGGMAYYIFLDQKPTLTGSGASLELLTLTSPPVALHLSAKLPVQKFLQPSTATNWGPCI